MIDVTSYLWIVWLIFVLICVIIELLTLEFTFLMIAFGSLAGLGANLLGWPWWLQIVVGAVVAVLLILTIRPLLLRVMRRGADPTPSNVPALIGMRARVLEPVDAISGLVKLANGETWSARLATASAAALEAGSWATVESIAGSIAMVAPGEPTPDPSATEERQ
ncbi:NfeD family protein [Ruicaihuangia caeni]|uniref:NfeD family protein n=1 Tax=Ruicaihuangia caeni TaxID=3042517 RepID=A0AAW6T769_9MICO|nr:NfeD family protein [Klugiella sp. YN-L-19]MDI2098203.1 NfeD family protein [Klugiella sp. YN-L-19]